MKIILYIFLIFLTFSLKAEEKTKILFSRKAQVGNMMKCRLSAFTSSSSKTSFAQIDRPDKINALNRRITATGTIKVLGVKKNGHASKIEFLIDSISGKINEKDFKPDWKGKKIIVDMKVKPICNFSLKGSDEKFSPVQIQMLSMLFQPAPEENSGDYIGTSKAVGIGDSWDARILPFVKLFRKQGIVFPQDKIKGSVVLRGRHNFEGFDCWEIEERLKVDDIPGFSFHFSLSLLLPVDEKYGNLKMTRKAFEKIEKKPQGKHFMTSGIKQITLEMKDTMTAVMIPQRNKK